MRFCQCTQWPQVRSAYVDKVSGKFGDLFRGYWAIMDRLEVSHGARG